MKLATAAMLPKKTLAKVNDPDNPAWTEDMLSVPVIQRERGPQALAAWSERVVWDKESPWIFRARHVAGERVALCFRRYGTETSKVNRAMTSQHTG